MTDQSAGRTLPEFSATLARLIEGVAHSVVEIHGSGRRAASGFVWRQGLVITAEEALGHGTAATVVVAGEAREAAVVGRDPSTDIALLRLDGFVVPPLTLSLDASPRLGELAIALGRRAQGATARLGIVSLAGPAWRSMRGGAIDRLLRLDLTLDRMGEGGPAIDSEGRVFGMAVRGPGRSVLAIPATTIERIAARILEKGSIRPGYLGLGLHPVRTAQPGREPGTALIVLGVAEDGPGHAAGVLQGDVITGWNGEPVAGLRDVMRRLGPDSAGQTIDLNVIRGNQPLSIRCVIGARPEP